MKTCDRIVSSIAGRLLRPLVQLRDGEATTALLMFLYSFLAMTSYNIIKPITRSEFISSLGADNLPYVQFGMGVLIGFIMQGYTKVMSVVPRRWTIPVTQAGMEGRTPLSQLLLAQQPGLTSLVLEAHLARSARLEHGLVALGHLDAALLGHLAVEQEPESSVALTSVSAGWGLARLEPRLLQVDGQAQSTLRGLQLVDGHQIADTHSHVHFGGPEGQLDQVHKAVAAGQGRSVFNGAVRVPRAAQRTNAAQLSRNLLLSDRARIDTKPELEIVADDVKCAHGATVSSLQTDELFYLQSRGIGSEQAAGLLKRAFCEEVLRELPAPARAWCPLEALQLEAP